VIKMTPLQMKVMKIIHLIAASLWLGGIVSVTIVQIGSNTFEAASQEYLFAMSLVLTIELSTIIPSSLILFFTGLFYGLFTNWGFIKNRWIAVKWLITILIIVASVVFYFLPGGILFCLIQLAVILTLFVIAVLKPWKRKRGTSKDV